MAEVMNYKNIRAASLLKETDDQKSVQRRKTILLLVIQYLQEEGFVEAAHALERETNIDLGKYQVCDNICLETILMDFEAYYFVKFNKYPNIIKKSQITSNIRNERRSCPLKKFRTLPNAGNDKNSILPKISSPNNKVTTSNGISKKEIPSETIEATDTEILMPIIGQSVKTNAENKFQKKPLNQNNGAKISDNWEEDKLLKPLGGFEGYTVEWKELAQVISRDIFSKNPDVKWTDIIGLDNAKSIVKESVVYPIKFPQFFKGILSPWKGLLLYGPPGTGKTLLAKAVATECQTTFFNISASSIVSKWRGDSEKLVRVLFELARFHAPSTIFLDEIDALMGQRGFGGSEHEGSRRMKTELLVQMDGLSKTEDLVFLLAASNLPWELDPALLRRLEKRVYVGLPSFQARERMLQHYLPSVICSGTSGIELRSSLDYEALSRATEGYSGSDVHVVCKEAAMRPLRKVFEVLEGNVNELPSKISLDSVKTEDVLWALEKIKPSTKNIVEKYLRWQKDFESG